MPPRVYNSGMAKKEKTKILLLYDFPIVGGGSGAYVKFLALRLSESQKYMVAIAAPEKTRIDKSIIDYRIKLPQIPVFIGRPGLESSKKYSDLSTLEIERIYEKFTNGLIKIVEEFKPDIIHVHHLMVHTWAARFIKAIYGTKLVTTSHGSCLFALSEDKRYIGLTKDALRASNLITVVSDDTKTRLIKMFGDDLAPKVKVIPGGIRKTKFPLKRRLETIDRIRKKYKLYEPSYVMFAGRLITEKGAEYLVKAADKINGPILIVGDGPQKEALKQMIKKSNLTNVTMLGFVGQDDLMQMYYLASVFVAPAVWDEPMGFTILEAMAASVPVVASRKVTFAIKDGVNGFHVQPRSSKDLTEKVNILLADYKLRRTLGKNARETVFNKYTWTEITKQFDKLYQSLL